MSEDFHIVRAAMEGHFLSEEELKAFSARISHVKEIAHSFTPLDDEIWNHIVSLETDVWSVTSFYENPSSPLTLLAIAQSHLKITKAHAWSSDEKVESVAELATSLGVTSKPTFDEMRKWVITWKITLLKITDGILNARSIKEEEHLILLLISALQVSMTYFSWCRLLTDRR